MEKFQNKRRKALKATENKKSVSSINNEQNDNRFFTSNNKGYMQ